MLGSKPMLSSLNTGDPSIVLSASVYISASTLGARPKVKNLRLKRFKRYAELPRSVMRSDSHIESANRRSSVSHRFRDSRSHPSFVVTNSTVDPSSTVPLRRSILKCSPSRLRILSLTRLFLLDTACNGPVTEDASWFCGGKRLCSRFGWSEKDLLEVIRDDIDMRVTNGL